MLCHGLVKHVIKELTRFSSESKRNSLITLSARSSTKSAGFRFEVLASSRKKTRESNPHSTRPNSTAYSQVTLTPPVSAANWQRDNDSVWQCLTSADPELAKVVGAWTALPVAIRRAIVVLVDSSDGASADRPGDDDLGGEMGSPANQLDPPQSTPTNATGPDDLASHQPR
jgi:hypothetical protein